MEIISKCDHKAAFLLTIRRVVHLLLFIYCLICMQKKERLLSYVREHGSCTHRGKHVQHDPWPGQMNHGPGHLPGVQPDRVDRVVRGFHGCLCCQHVLEVLRSHPVHARPEDECNSLSVPRIEPHARNGTLTKDQEQNTRGTERNKGLGTKQHTL